MSDPNSIIPPDPEGLFPTRKISRPAVLITAGAALGLVFLLALEIRPLVLWHYW